MKSGNTIAAQQSNTIAAQPIQLPLNQYNCRSTNTIAAQRSDVHELEQSVFVDE